MPRAPSLKDPDLFARGAFGAVVDMATGSVTQLSQHSTLAYFNPGCGDDEHAVLSLQRGGDEGESPAQTRMVTMDTATAGARYPAERLKRLLLLETHT